MAKWVQTVPVLVVVRLCCFRVQEQENTGHCEGNVQRLFQELQTLTETPTDRRYIQTEVNRTPPSSSSSSSSCNTRLTRRKPAPTLSPKKPAAEGQSSGSEDFLTSGSREKGTPASLEVRIFKKKIDSVMLPFIYRLVLLSQKPPSASPVHNVIHGFLEEEILRSEELLQKLDLHIQGMRESNTRTAFKYRTNGMLGSEWLNISQLSKAAKSFGFTH